MKTPLARILADKNNDVCAVEPTVAVAEAVARMTEAKTGSVLVMEGDVIDGIFTERDVLHRVVARGRSPDATPVSQVMTTRVVSVLPETTVEEALAIITEHRCRHLPVMEDGVLLGMVSAGDLNRWLTHSQRFHIEQLVNYITGKYPA